MAKHRLEQPSRTGKLAKTAVIAGSIGIGAIAASAGPALAAPVSIPGVGTFDLPGVSENQIPQEFRGGGGNILAPVQSVGERALAAANTKVGAPYSYGAAGPNAFDCSGLVNWAYKQAGKSIPRDSYGQAGGGVAVPSLAAAKPGDVLIMNGGGHAGIYAGNGRFIHSSTYGVPVGYADVKSWSITAIRRY